MTAIVMVLFSLALCPAPSLAAGDGIHRFEAAGTIGAGLFLPTGKDADLVRRGPSLQLGAVFAFWRFAGIDAEYDYVPVRLVPGTLPQPRHRTTQMAALAGLRLQTGRLLDRGPGLFYLGLRGGFARVVTTADAVAPQGPWIAGVVGDTAQPSGAPGFTTRKTDKGLALSPRVGVILKLARSVGVDLAAQPLFIFNRGALTTQVQATASLSFHRRSEL
jgi:hypothetical protein